MKRIAALALGCCLLALLLAFACGSMPKDDAVVITPLGRSRHVSQVLPRSLPDPQADGEADTDITYVFNTRTHKFHRPDCSGAASMKEENRQLFTGSREEALALGYLPCGVCKP